MSKATNKRHINKKVRRVLNRIMDAAKSVGVSFSRFNYGDGPRNSRDYSHTYNEESKDE